ncbi:MAG: MBL fold metallo-hydrolase [Candidatus Obscuribacterales bacterium]|nr:MBL fold metallo-hydrolase [Candidatus Obscuribacterales bacterium]
MYFKQYFLGCLAHASYMVADEGSKTACVIDPQRDIEQYLADAEKEGFQIKHVILTHFHADFLSGHLEFQERLGATIYLGAKGQAEYAFQPLKEGDTLDLGSVRLRILETPGHTPEAISILVFDANQSSDKPHSVLTGDTLFVGDVGRPDLLASSGVTERELAGMLYDSLRNKLMVLPDETLVYPAHGAGSMCGKKMGKETFSTIGQQKMFNYALQPMSKEDFIREVTADQPEAPLYFAYNASLNKQMHKTLQAQMDQSLKSMSLPEFLSAQKAGALILDARNPGDFCKSHLKGSLNIGLSGNYASWAGALLDPKEKLLLVAPPGKEEEAVMRLGRIGYDNILGYLSGGAAAFAENGEAVNLPRVTAVQLKDKLDSKAPPLVLDVRAVSEWQDKHLNGSVNIPLNQLSARVGELPKDREIVVHCLGGYRSTIAASILSGKGFKQISDVVGGINAWLESSLPVVCGQEKIGGACS